MYKKLNYVVNVVAENEVTLTSAQFAVGQETSGGDAAIHQTLHNVVGRFDAPPRVAFEGAEIVDEEDPQDVIERVHREEE